MAENLADREPLSERQLLWQRADARLGITDDPDRAEASEVLRLLWHRKAAVVACIVITGLIFFVLTARQTEVFTARVTLLLDPRGQQVVAAQDEVVADLDLTSATMESEIALLSSPALMRKVAGEIGFDHLRHLDPGPRQYGLLGDVLNGLKRVLSGRPSHAPVPAPLAEARRQARIVTALIGGTAVHRVGQSYMLSLRVTLPDPDVAAQVANALAEAHVAKQLEERRNVTIAATRWLADQIDNRRADLLLAERALDQLRQSQLAQVGVSDEVMAQRVVELNRQLAVSRADTATEKARVRQIEQQLAEQGPIEVAKAQASRVLADLRSDRQALNLKQSQLASKFGEAHRERTRLRDEIAEIDALLVAEVHNILQRHRNEIAVLQQRQNSLQAEISALETALSKAATGALDVGRLETEVDISRERYENLLTRLADIRAQTDIQRADLQIVSAAEIPLGPSAPRPKLMGFFGASIGLALGLIAVLLSEALARGFKSAGRLERATGLPVLGVLSRPRNSWLGIEVPFGLRSEGTSPAGMPEQLTHLLSIAHKTETKSQHTILMCPV